MDVLSSLLREMRLESVGYRWLELRAPWHLSFGQAGLRGVHIVVRGRCELLIDGEAPRVLEAGDLVLAPRADAHALRSIGGRRAKATDAGVIATAPVQNGRVGWGGTGEETLIVCGAFLFHAADHHVLACLPRILHLPGEDGRAAPWLAALTEALAAEAQEMGAGSDLVMARLSDALVARALRIHAHAALEPGWLRGLSDPGLARALAAMHDDLARPWTLASLARAAGLSRAAFAARFTAQIGAPAMQYLLGRRMRRAMALLADEQMSLARVAESVGYGSEAAFSAAFKRHTGAPPGSYRKHISRRIR